MQTSDSILITGSTGFVGKNLVNKLKELGYTNLLLPKIDLTNQLQTNHYFREHKPDYVIHLAARVGGIAKNIAEPYKFLNENLMMQSNVINAAIDNKVKKFLFLSSSCCYPKDYPIQPLKEEYMMKADLEPTNYGYALAKIAGMKMCEYANKQTDTRFITLVPCNLYGPGDHFDLQSSHALAALIMKTFIAVIKNENEAKISVWGSGNQRREWLYIDDLIDCLLWSMENLEKTETFLNVGTGIDISMNDLAQEIIKPFGISQYNQNLTIQNDLSKPDGMMKKCLDVSNINALGWKAKTSLRDGIRNTLRYYAELIHENYRTKSV